MNGWQHWVSKAQKAKGESCYRWPPAAHSLTIHGFTYKQVGYLGHPLLNVNEDLHCCVMVWTPSSSCAY